MKKVLIYSLLAFIFVSCTQSPEKKAQELIKIYMNENLKDPSSYEIISFSELDSVFTPYMLSEEGKRLYELGSVTGEYHKKAFDFEVRVISASKNEIKELEDSIKFYANKEKETWALYEKNEANYKGEFYAWRITHDYRAKNGFGALDKGSKTFLVTPDITEIIRAFD